MTRSREFFMKLRRNSACVLIRGGATGCRSREIWAASAVAWRWNVVAHVRGLRGAVDGRNEKDFGPSDKDVSVLTCGLL